MRQSQPQRSRRRADAPRRHAPLRSLPGGAVPADGAQGIAAFPGAPADPFRTEPGRFGLESQLLSLSAERRELTCSLIGLAVKLGLVAVTGVSLVRLAGAYQQRMERQGEIAAVLELENAKLTKARERFDDLFMVEGEQRLIREQSQWIAPNRLRVVWQSTEAFPSVESPAPGSGKRGSLP